MNVSRRWFIGGMAGFSAATGLRLFAQTGAASVAGARMKMGILSDIHLNKEGDEDTYLKALAYFRDHGADGVLIAGDIDGRACDISYVQLALLGYAAVVQHMAALAQRGISPDRYTPGYYLHGMPMRRIAA